MPSVPLNPVSVPLKPTAQRQQLRDASQAFEAIMLRQWLAAARAGSMAEKTPLTGGGLAQFQSMRDERFAEIAAKNGSLGFADAIENQLARFLPPAER